MAPGSLFPLSAFGQAEGRAGHRATDHDTETVAHSPDHAEPPPRCSTCSMPHGIAGRCRTFPFNRIRWNTTCRKGQREDWTLILFPHAMVSVRYPDVAESGQNALEHYVLYGASELRDPSEYFDVQQYCTEYAALIPAGANPLVHFLRHGARAGLNPNPYFDTRWYLSRYQRVTQSAFNPLVHYLIEGERLGYLPSPEFDPVRYAQTHADTLNWRYGALSHYLIFGRYEGRMLSPNPPAQSSRPPARSLTTYPTSWSTNLWRICARDCQRWNPSRTQRQNLRAIRQDRLQRQPPAATCQTSCRQGQS